MENWNEIWLNMKLSIVFFINTLKFSCNRRIDLTCNYYRFVTIMHRFLVKNSCNPTCLKYCHNIVLQVINNKTLFYICLYKYQAIFLRIQNDTWYFKCFIEFVGHNWFRGTWFSSIINAYLWDVFFGDWSAVKIAQKLNY